MRALSRRLLGAAFLAALASLAAAAIALGQDSEEIIISDTLAPKRLEVSAERTRPAHKGGIWVMKHYHHEFRIEAPVEHVWAFFGDTTHWEDWMPRRKTSDISGPLDKVGTTYVQSAKLMGYEMKWTTEVMEVEPLRLVRLHSDWGPTDTTFRFEPDGDATNIVVDSDYEMLGKMPGFIKDFMSKGWMERNMARMFEDFKTLAEANVPAHA